MSLDPRRTMSLDLVAPPNFTPSLPQNSILRRPTLEEVVLRRSSLELASNRHLPPSSLESSRSSLQSRCTRATNFSPDHRPSSGTTSSSSDNASGSYFPSSKSNGKRVSFHGEVAQAREVFTHRDSDERIMTQQQLRKSRNISDENRRQSSEPLIHEPIESTTLAQPGHVLPRPGESNRSGALGAYASFFEQTAKPGNVLATADAAITKPLLNSQTALYKKSLKKQIGAGAVARDVASRGRARATSVTSSAVERVGSAVRTISLGSSQNSRQSDGQFSAGASNNSPAQVNISDEVIRETEPQLSNLRRSEQENQQPQECPQQVANSRGRVEAQEDRKVSRPRSSNCMVMSAKMPPMPQIQILSDEDFFEIEMFGLPRQPAVVEDIDVRSDISSSTISDASSEDVEDVDFPPVESKLPVGSNIYFAHYDAYSSSVIKDQSQCVLSCSTEPRIFSSSFAVQMPMVASPMMMDDEEEYWFMNV